MVAPVVLNRVFDSHELSAAVDRKSFIEAVTVSPYTLRTNLILQKYDLNVRDLSQVEIGEMEARLGAELAQASSGSVAIRFRSSAGHSIPEERMRAVMRAIPQAWNDHRINDLGVTNYSSSMYSSRAINRSLIESIDYLIAFEMVLNRLDLLRMNLATIESIPNGTLIKDPETGVSVVDLRRGTQDVQNYQVSPLVNTVRKLGIAMDLEVVRLYFENLLESGERWESVLNHKLQNVKSTFIDYVANRDPMSEGVPGPAVGTTMIPQIGSEFLDRIVEMTNAGMDITYRQQLNSTWQTKSQPRVPKIPE